VPKFLFYVYAPGYLAGLVFCALQGHYEHAGATTSHYGRVYNWLCFNDGFHVEHHAHPGVHWSELPGRVLTGARSSRWPALLRWADACTLDRLERLVLRSGALQAFVLSRHQQAFRRLLHGTGSIQRGWIVGGGLFPRTALVLRDLLPGADLCVIDADASNLELGRRIFRQVDRRRADGVAFECRRFTGAGVPDDVDLVVVPLAFSGDRERVYAQPPARLVIVHDWCWRRRGRGCLVSLLLLKRLNLVER
jgi:hypothetical protein